MQAGAHRLASSSWSSTLHITLFTAWLLAYPHTDLVTYFNLPCSLQAQVMPGWRWGGRKSSRRRRRWACSSEHWQRSWSLLWTRSAPPEAAGEAEPVASRAVLRGFESHEGRPNSRTATVTQGSARKSIALRVA